MILPHVNAVSLLTVDAAQNRNLCDRKNCGNQQKPHKKPVEWGGVRLFFLGVLVFCFCFSISFFHFRPPRQGNRADVGWDWVLQCFLSTPLGALVVTCQMHLSLISHNQFAHTQWMLRNTWMGWGGYLMHCSSQPIQPDPGRYGVTFQ